MSDHQNQLKNAVSTDRFSATKLIYLIVVHFIKDMGWGKEQITPNEKFKTLP